MEDIKILRVAYFQHINYLRSWLSVILESDWSIAGQFSYSTYNFNRILILYL